MYKFTTQLLIVALMGMSQAHAQAPAANGSPPVAVANPFAKPSAAVSPPSPSNPVPGNPQLPAVMPNVSTPMAPPLPPSAITLPPLVPPAPEVAPEEVSVVRIGKVNGQYIYRGTGTYLFEMAKEKLQRKPVVQASSLPALPTNIPGSVSLNGASGSNGNNLVQPQPRSLPLKY